MRGKQHLTRKAQFDSVYNNSSPWVEKTVVMRATPNGLDISRYGFSVSRRVGNAVVRNRVKRLLREILRKAPLRPGWDLVFIARPAVAGSDYDSLGEAVAKLLCRAGLLLGEYEGIRRATN